MDKDRGFTFKLLVPPRVNRGQISAVRPQEIVEDWSVRQAAGGQQGFNPCIDKALPKANMVVPNKPGRQDIPKSRVVPSVENDENNSGQLYTMLFDEVDKIKSWKAKVDSETMKNDRSLQENRRIIETQRKAIQDLQFENEGLSIKLEEEIHENQDLRIKNNATRNLCHLLKDTFERSSEKINSFESEREETHQLFLENNESIQGMITAFETLRIQAEADRHEMLQVKEGLLQFEVLKDKVDQEYRIKYDEVKLLEKKLKEKEDELEKLMVNLKITQESCRLLEEENGKQKELIKSSKHDQDSVLHKLQYAEELCKETEKNLARMTSAMEKTKEDYAQLNQQKDLRIEELSKAKYQQANALVEMQAAANERESLLSSEKERGKELELKLQDISMEMEDTMAALGETREKSLKKDEEIKVAADELEIKSQSIGILMERNKCIEAGVQETAAELSRANEEAKLFKGKVEILSAERELQKKAGLRAEKAHNELKEKARMAEEKVQEVEAKLLVELEQRQASTFHMEQQKKDIIQHEIRYGELLSRYNDVHMKLEEKLKASEERELDITREVEGLEDKSQHLREEVSSLNIQIQEQYKKTADLENQLLQSDENLQDKITKKEKQYKVMEAKLCNLKAKFEAKSKTQEERNTENKTLKKQMAKEIERCGHLEDKINHLKEECEHMKRENEGERKRLLEELDVKTTMAAELENEVQILKLTASEVTKNKEDLELKCQHKIADMVALMEKHKNQYDEMVKEKDAELEETKNTQKEAFARKSSLELELFQNKIENDDLKNNLKKAMKETVRAVAVCFISAISICNPISHEFYFILVIVIFLFCSPVPKENVDILKETFPKTKSAGCKNNNGGFSTANIQESNRKTPSWNTIQISGRTPKHQDISKEIIKTPSWSTGTVSRIGATPKIKSYRIRTPPSLENSAPWGRGTLELDPKSDSSEPNDLMTFADEPEPRFSAKQRKGHTLKTNKSPAVYKSPGNSLKMAAIKRMRDAGWITVASSDEKKKKVDQKIFA
ncbi:synaptonemal complex protein 1 [Gadus macrocephalus]|uniref:synaptonemal complex protein 1 n=1 Tax=Gadus macrocephalus TaxID=80720 RepID=UPI0028CB704C|nr:synaptonemal complex protein 1 [Gadus macrocephalus]